MPTFGSRVEIEAGRAFTGLDDAGAESGHPSLLGRQAVGRYRRDRAAGLGPGSGGGGNDGGLRPPSAPRSTESVFEDQTARRLKPPFASSPSASTRGFASPPTNEKTRDSGRAPGLEVDPNAKNSNCGCPPLRGGPGRHRGGAARLSADREEGPPPPRARPQRPSDRPPPRRLGQDGREGHSVAGSRLPGLIFVRSRTPFRGGRQS